MNPDSPGERLTGAIFVAIAACLWATLGLVAKLTYAEGIAFQAVVAVRAVGAFLIIFAFLVFSGRARSLRVEGRDLRSLVPLGIVCIGCFYLLYFYTVQESEVGTAAVLLYSSPAFVVVLARIFLKEAMSALRLLALLLTAVGIVLVVGIGSGNLDVRPFVVLTGLGSGLAYGLFSVVGKPLTRRLSTAVINCYMLGIGAVILTAFALPHLGTLFGHPAWVYLLLVAAAVLVTALPYALYTVGLGKLDAGQAAIIASIEPAVAGFIGFAFLSEEMTVTKVIGGLLVILGAVVAQIRLRRPRKSLSRAGSVHPH